MSKKHKSPSSSSSSSSDKPSHKYFNGIIFTWNGEEWTYDNPDKPGWFDDYDWLKYKDNWNVSTSRSYYLETIKYHDPYFFRFWLDYFVERMAEAVFQHTYDETVGKERDKYSAAEKAQFELYKKVKEFGD